MHMLCKCVHLDRPASVPLCVGDSVPVHMPAATFVHALRCLFAHLFAGDDMYVRACGGKCHPGHRSVQAAGVVKYLPQGLGSWETTGTF